MAGEGKSNFLYTMKEDGTDRQKFLPDTLNRLDDVSPDGNWIVAEIPVHDADISRAVVAYPTSGGTPVRICAPGCETHWSADGRFFYVRTESQIAMRGNKTFAIPLLPGKSFPSLPVTGIQSEKDLSTIPGARAIDSPFDTPGPDPSTFAYARSTTRSNLYRIPLN
jgi:hypothetical protein